MPALICHPTTPAPTVLGIEASVSRQDGELVFSYCLRGDMARILVPAADTKHTETVLWEHTCFEAFIGLGTSPEYREYNFSPSGRHATHAFSGYREPVPDAAPLPPARIEIQHTAGRLELVARVVAAELPPPYANAALQIGLSAVIETTDTVGGNRSYWALRHVSQRPDFHQRASFVLQLGAP